MAKKGATAEQSKVVDINRPEDEKLQQYLRKILALKSEAQSLSRDIRTVYEEAEGEGYEKLVLKEQVRIIQMADRSEDRQAFWMNVNSGLRRAGYRQLCLWD